MVLEGCGEHVCISFLPRCPDVPAVMTYPPAVYHMVSADLREYNRPLRFQYNVDRGVVCHKSFENCLRETRFFFLTILQGSIASYALACA